MPRRSYSEPILEDGPLLRCEPEYDAIICFKCNNDFLNSQIITHLNKHHITHKLYGPILATFPREMLANDWENLGRPSNGSAPIEGLKVRSGYACIGCDILTTSEELSRTHLKSCGQIDRVHLQCWNPI